MAVVIVGSHEEKGSRGKKLREMYCGVVLVCREKQLSGGRDWKGKGKGRVDWRSRAASCELQVQDCTNDN